jgi:hypothetical protein
LRHRESTVDQHNAVVHGARTRLMDLFFVK